MYMGLILSHSFHVYHMGMIKVNLHIQYRLLMFSHGVKFKSTFFFYALMVCNLVIAFLYVLNSKEHSGGLRAHSYANLAHDSRMRLGRVSNPKMKVCVSTSMRNFLIEPT